jgi:4-hydroxyphenylpyruvate dioxygenase
MILKSRNHGSLNVQRSIATVCLGGTLEEKLDAIAAAHFTGMEIFENDLVFSAASPRDLRVQAADLGLTIDLFQPFRDFEGVANEKLRRNLDRAERKFDVMAQLGAPLMLVCSSVAPDAIDDDARVAAQLYELADRAARRGVRVGYEALAWGTHVRTFDRAWSIVARVNHPHLGLILDSFHTLALPDDWSGLSKLPGERIFFVQLADAPRLGMNPLMLSRHFRCFPGQGELDVCAFMQAVLATGYTGPISLEVFSDDLRAAPPRQTSRDAMRSLLFVEESVRRATERQISGAAGRSTRRRVDLFDPPLPPKLAGVTFVEFTVDDKSEKQFAATLAQLGFRRIGRHVSKDVSLFAQGDIRIVLNKEPDSFAHSYFLMHGLSVCALALSSDDAMAGLGRAEAYGCTRMEGRIGPNEHAIPAIRSLDGSPIYFTDDRGSAGSNFETDFVIDREATEADMPILDRIDHIAQALPEGQLDSWVLFYRAVLGLEPESHVILNDPYGIVRSRAVSNRERTVRIPLNFSESRNTATARSISAFSGAGVHHIAFSTADIFAAARRLALAHAPILRIPSNYYEDIAARFELADDLVARLREFNVLYDRSESGEFFQIYTMPSDDRFFFEIVERSNGYDLYGAANAPVRMAAFAELRGRNLARLLD